MDAFFPVFVPALRVGDGVYSTPRPRRSGGGDVIGPVGGGGRLGPHLLGAEARDHLQAQRHSIMLWSAVPDDWRDPDGWPARALEQCLAEPEPLPVLHDMASGTTRHLDAFLGILADAGAGFGQEFPDACLPMIRGAARHGRAQYVTPARAEGDAA